MEPGFSSAEFTPIKKLDRRLFEEIDNGRLIEWCRGNEEARRFLLDFGHAVHICDDVVDGDARDVARALQEMVMVMLVRLPSNAWYRQYQGWFIPLYVTSWTAYTASVDWEKSGDKDKLTYAFFYRFFVNEVIVMTAFLVGGREHANSVQTELQEYLASDESLETWFDEHD